MFVNYNPHTVFSYNNNNSNPSSFFRRTIGALEAKVNAFASKIARPLTFPGSANKFKDKERLERSKEELSELGGEAILLNTPDGTQLEGMYFDVDKVKEALEINEKTHVHQRVHLWSKRWTRFIEVPNQNLNETLRDSLEWDHYRSEITVPVSRMKRMVRSFLQFIKLSPPVKPRLSFIFSLGSAEYRNPLANQHDGKRPTVILCPGGGCTFQMLKRVLIPGYLRRGINVMAVNYRGYGRSGGIPTEKGLIQDLETAYQYVSQVRQVPDNKIIMHGHCLGALPAVETAKNHPGVHLVLDRAFANYKLAIKDSLGNVVEDIKSAIVPKVPGKLQSCVNKIIDVVGKALVSLVAFLSPLIGRFDVESRLNKVKGSIALIYSENDEVLSSVHKSRLSEKINQLNSRDNISVLSTVKGHSDAWIDESANPIGAIDDQFDRFLLRNSLLGSLV